MNRRYDGCFQPCSRLASFNGVLSVRGWFESITKRKQIRADRQILEKRVRHFLESYLAASPTKKNEFYEAIAGAASACRPSMADPTLENIERAQKTSELALKVVQARFRRGADVDHVQSMITDAYATIAIAHRRSAAAYTTDPEMQRLGTAAVHLVTMATSYMALMGYEA
jgi:hypothetical protein